MDPEQMAAMQQLRGIYGNQPGPQPNRPTQAMPFQGFQVPQHAPLAGPQLGGGGQGGGGGQPQQQGNMMEGAQKLIGGLMQNRAGRQAGAPATTPTAPGQAGPPIVGSQAEMGPFMSQMSPPGPPAVQGGSVVGGQPTTAPPPQPAPAAPQPAPVPPPRPPMPAPGAGTSGFGPGGMPQMMRVGGELPDWLFKLPGIGGAIGL